MQSSPRIDELRQKFHENPRRYFAPLANEYRKAGDPEQAIAICRAHLAQQPAHMSGHVVYGQALFDAHRTDEAREVFQLALALDPENVIVLRHLGDIARQRGDVQEARSWYSRALDGDPHDSEIAAYLAELTEPLVSHGAEPDSPPAVVPHEESAEQEAPAEPEEFAGDQPVPAHHEEEIAETAPQESESAVEAPAEAPRESEESPYLETDEAAAPSEEAEPEAAPQPVERQSRLTPTGEGFPILTRTLAELYLQQGHIEAALDIYRQLAEHEPHDEDIRARIAALSFDESAEKAFAHDLEPEPEPERVRESEPEEPEPEPEPEPEHVLTGTPVDETVLGEELKEAADFTGDDLEVTDLMGTCEEPTPEWGEVTRTSNAAPEEQEAVGTPGSETLWDTADFWGGGFFEDTDAEDEIFGLTDDALSVAAGSEAAKRVSEPELAPDIVLESETESDVEIVEFVSANLAAAAYFENPEPFEDESPYAPEAEIGADFEPDTVAEAPLAEGAHAGLVEPAARELTIREFFATLGSMRPPFAGENGETEEGVDDEAASGQESASEAATAEQGYGFADDAFANLFANAPINSEDSRAAAALSSAVAHGAPFSTPSTPPGSHRAAPAPPREAPAQPGQESEEDIRRFREWLDGLAES